jgi:CheY-like chemotaxis protein
MRAARMGRRDEPEGAGPMAELVSVLVVDDEEIVLKSVKRILKDDDEHEFLVDTARSATEGLGRADQTEYDIIVADLMMPDIDGLEFIERIRRTNTRSKIIMITGQATMDSSLRALRKGAFEYLAKPFTIKEL